MKYVVNDARHGQLKAQERPSQTLIDALARGVGNTQFGACDVKDLAAKSALTHFTMGGRGRGTAWSLNPYVGCLHACRYCYVPQTMHLERARWGTYVLAKGNLPSLLRVELEDHERRTVYVSTSTDPYQSLEAERRITRSCLRVLARTDWPVDVLTRSPLVTRDIDVLRRFREARIGLSIPTLDDEVRRRIEPYAPPIAARLRALRTLADAGLTVYANYAPAYPGTTFEAADVARELAAAGARWVNTSAWRYQSAYLGGLYDDLRGSDLEQLARLVGSPRRQAALRRQLDVAFAARGLPLRTGFFNDPFPSRLATGAQAAIHRFDADDRPCS